MNISVCMATFNGGAYLNEQIDSIMVQLRAGDELIVVDDCSTDRTLTVLEGVGDPRIQVYANDSNQGPVSSFDRAVSLAKGDVIIMADQDDRWLTDRVSALVKELVDSGAMVVSSNSTYMDAEGREIDYRGGRISANDSRKHLKNIRDIFSGKAAYYGCAMAFRSQIKPLILPIPKFVESHDLWIALASNLIRSNRHLDVNTMVRRIHGKNASILKRKLHLKLWSRIIFIYSLLVLLYRIPKWRGITRRDAALIHS